MDSTRIPRSVRLPEDLDAYVIAASAATGISISELVVECVRESIDRVIERRLANHKSAVDALADLRRLRGQRAK